jgi:SPP1 family predicted phage head-tail adaptor
MTTLTAGSMNRRIQIQAQTTTQDEVGQPEQVWNTIYECWANIDVQNTQLLFSTAEFMSKATYRISLRWTSSVIIGFGNRIVYVEPTTNVQHLYEVQAVINTKQANKEMVLMAYELGGSE